MRGFKAPETHDWSKVVRAKVRCLDSPLEVDHEAVEDACSEDPTFEILGDDEYGSIYII
jgi:hypothetical protein